MILKCYDFAYNNSNWNIKINEAKISLNFIDFVFNNRGRDIER